LHSERIEKNNGAALSNASKYGAVTVTRSSAWNEIRHGSVMQSSVLISRHRRNTGDGAVAFKHACEIGLEGIVSKRRDSRYISGRSKAWLKIKIPSAPGVMRFQDRE
jgi:hypothetical protein